MSKDLAKYIKIGVLALAGLGVVIFLVKTLIASAQLSGAKLENAIAFNGIMASIWLLILGAINLFTGFALGLVEDFKRAIVSVIGIAVILLIFIIGFAASPDLPAGMTGIEDYAGTSFKVINGGLITFYVLLVIAVIAFLYDLVTSFVKG